MKLKTMLIPINLGLSTCLLLFLQSNLVFGQNTRLQGKITDSKNLPLVAVSVYIKGSTLGTTTNSEGSYRLELKPGHYELAFSLIGFQRLIKPIDISYGQNTLDITLSESSYGLTEVVVKAGRENPAVRIMRNAIARRSYFSNQVKAYRCQVYIKGIQKLRNAPKKIFGQDVQGELKNMGLDSGKRGILYLSESVSRLAVKKPGRIHEEIISSKVSGRNNGFSINNATDFMTDFYQNLLAIGSDKFISPLADNGFSVYQFKLKGTTINDGQKIYRIQVIPKRKGANLFQGLIYIQDSLWNIQSTDLMVAKGSKLELLDTLQIRQQFIEPRPGIFLLSTTQYNFSGGAFGFNFFGNYLETFSGYDLEPVFTAADFPSDVLHISAASNKKDSAYWNTVRPVPLTREEKVDYVKKDSIFNAHETKPYKDSVDRVRNKFKPLGIILTGQTFQNSFKKTSFYIAPPSFMLSYNTVEGLVFNPQIRFNKKLTDTSSFSIGSSLRYGFINKRFNPSATLFWNVNALKHQFITLSSGSKVIDQNKNASIDPLFNTWQTLFSKINLLKLYESHFATIVYSQNASKQVNLGGSLEFENRIPLANTAYDYISGKASQHFTANNPYSAPGNTLAFKVNQALTLNLFATFNFGEKFIVRPDMIIPRGSDYPTLTIQYRKGIRGILGSDVDYDLLKARLSQKDIETGALGRFNYSVSGGKFMNKKSMYYLDYEHFSTNQTTLLFRENAFEILNSYRFSAADYFLHAHVEQNFQGAFLSKLPLIRKLKLEELIGASILRNDQVKNYSEVYLGIQRFGLRASYTISFIGGNRYMNGFSLNLGGF